jgi:hypothetical protein
MNGKESAIQQGMMNEPNYSNPLFTRLRTCIWDNHIRNCWTSKLLGDSKNFVVTFSIGEEEEEVDGAAYTDIIFHPPKCNRRRGTTTTSRSR